MLMERKDLILQLNELKGKIGQKIEPSIITQIAEIYGKWLKNTTNRVIIGRDGRPNGVLIERAIIEGLNLSDCEIINLGVCPTPILFYIKNKLKIKGAIFISDSNKPLNWNKIKLYFNDNFSYQFELKDLGEKLNQVNLDSPDQNQNTQIFEKFNPISTYFDDLFEFFEFERIFVQNKLRVIVDPGAGAGKLITPKVLEKLGCEVLVINDELDKYNNSPRELYPTKSNLKDLILALWKGNYDVGFAHDFDANKLTVISDNFECYSEEIISALIMDHYIRKDVFNDKTYIFLLNLASSLRFEVLADQNNIQVFRNYNENQFSKEKIEELFFNNDKYVIFGFKGLNGGPIFPHFNRVKDGIYIAAKLVEILVDSGEKLSQLMLKIPKFYSYQKKVRLPQKNLDDVIRRLNKELTKEGEFVIQVDNNLRFGYNKDWFVLITPSNNSIKVFSEARRDSLARLYCETTTELLRLIVSKI
ncbi:MAG: hypothetical protein EU532_06605 [Promethearchaeota archaeon]|nr:MAG: hypothetical protein EU532_06605 [Candidatus Lokiarchaeota archaeon]